MALVESLNTDATETPFRSPPHNIEAEQELLGAILVNNQAAERVDGFLRPEHFFHATHQRIYDAALKLITRGEIATPTTLKPFFERDDSLKHVGGAAYLAKLAAAATAIINAETYGKAIHDLALRRELVRIGESMVNTAYDSAVDDPANEQIEHAEQELFDVAERGRNEGGFINFKQSLTQSIDMVQSAFKKGGLSGVATGLKDLDAKLGGLHKSDLVILAARPSMGKSALATNIAFNAAKSYADSNGQEGARVAYFSLEMSAEQLATRILAEQTGIPSDKLRKGEIDDDDFIHQIVPVAGQLEEIPFFVDDTGALNISALRTRARRLKRTHGIGLIIVDYLQLVRPARPRRDDSRVNEVSEVTQGLKALAKDLDVPVLALAQLSRAVESRDDKRPQLADLRESGAIEQDADVVMFIYREEYYERRKEPAMNTPQHAEWQEKMDQIHNLADVIIGKQRHGPIGNVTLHFNGPLTKFSDHAQSERFPSGQR